MLEQKISMATQHIVVDILVDIDIWGNVYV